MPFVRLQAQQQPGGASVLRHRTHLALHGLAGVLHKVPQHLSELFGVDVRPKLSKGVALEIRGVDLDPFIAFCDEIGLQDAFNQLNKDAHFSSRRSRAGIGQKHRH